MKRVIAAFISIFILTSCYINSEEEVEEKKVSEKAYLLRDTQIKERKELEFIWTLFDGRTEEVVMTVEVSELGYVKGEGLEEELVIQFARNLAQGIDQPLINPTITRTGEVKAGQKKVILSELELVEKMMSLAYYNKQLHLPIYEQEPSVTLEDLEIIKNLMLGSYTTYFNPNVHGRSVNINLSSEAIDHFVLGPSEVFSFNKAVGQRTRERGYQEAKEIVNKQFVLGIGGGICQTSSTLFNAIDKAGLEVVERYTHSREIGYVPTGRDATVSWEGPDFKFKNPYDIPILISAQTNLKTGKVEVQVYSSQMPGKAIASNQ